MLNMIKFINGFRFIRVFIDFMKCPHKLGFPKMKNIKENYIFLKYLNFKLFYNWTASLSVFKQFATKIEVFQKYVI